MKPLYFSLFKKLIGVNIFEDVIPRGLGVNQTIRIEGSKDSNVNDSVIALKANNLNDPRKQVIVLSMNIQFRQNRIIRNSYVHREFTDGKWGTDETRGGQPIALNEDYEISITARENKFEIAVNCEHFADYTYRMPLEMVKYISVSGNLGPLEITKEIIN